MIDRKNFTVRTRVQQVNYLDGQARQRLIFVENLCRFWSKRGQELEKLPIIAQAPLDVCRCRAPARNIVLPNSHSLTVSLESLWRNHARRRHLSQDSLAVGLTRLASRLYHEVRLRGGMAAVTEKKQWSDVSRAMEMGTTHGELSAGRAPCSPLACSTCAFAPQREACMH